MLVETADDSLVNEDQDAAAHDEEEEEEEEKVSQMSQKMDLGSPLDSDPEFDFLSGEQEAMADEGTLVKEEDISREDLKEEDLDEAEEEEKKKEEEEEKMEDQETTPVKDELKEENEKKKEKGGATVVEKRIERLDSTFDSSYEPATEELLYEGDPDTDMKTSEQKTEEKDTSLHEGGEGRGEKMAATSAAERRDEDEGFMVEVHYKDQGGVGVLEEPAAAAIAPISSSKEASREKARKSSHMSSSSSSVGKTSSRGDTSSRFVLPCRSLCPPISLSTAQFSLFGAHSMF